MKKYFKYLWTFALMLGLVACAKSEPAVVPVSSVSLDKSSVELTEGETLTLKATVNPENATDKTVTWSSDKEEFATVKDGVVTAVKAGEANITAKASDKTAVCKVTVKASRIPVTSIDLNSTEVKLAVGGAGFDLVASVNPSDATDKRVTYSSSDEGIAMVSTTGKIMPVAAGSCKITVASVSDPEVTKECNVTVSSTIIPVTGVSINNKSATSFYLNQDTPQFTCTVSPADATNRNVTWSSTNTAVATIDQTGKLTLLKVGDTNIMVTTQDGGKTDQLLIHVYDTPITSITITDKSKTTFLAGEKYTPAVEVLPETASNKEYTVTVNPSSAATVSGKEVTFKSVNGSVTITVTSKVSSKTDNLSAFVEIPVSGVSLDKATLKGQAGNTFSLKATVTPSTAKDVSVKWSSDNEAVATVADGTVTMVAPGTCNVKAISVYDESKFAICAVTVMEANEISINDGAPQTYSEGGLKALLTAAGTVTKLVWTKASLMGGKDVDAIRDAAYASTLTYVDMSKVSIIATSDKYYEDLAHTSYPKTTQNDLFPKYMFRNFESLATVILPESVTAIGSYSLSYTAIASCTIPANVTKIESYAFSYNKKLTGTFTIPDKVQKLAHSMLSETSVTKVIIGAGVDDISCEGASSHAFSYMQYVTEFEVSPSNATFKAVDGCLCDKSGTTLYCYPAAKAVSSYKTPAGVTVVKEHAFCYTNGVQCIEISEGVTTLEEYAVDNCYNGVQTIILPSSLTAVNSNTVFSCGCTSILLNVPTPSPLSAKPFNNVSRLTYIFVPEASIEAYKTAAYWSDYKDLYRPIEEIGNISGVNIPEHKLF